MRPASKRQKEVMDYMRDYVRDHGFAPTQAEIADALHMGSPQAAAHHIHALARKGWLRTNHKKPRAITLINPDSVPVIDLNRTRSADETIPAESEIDDSVQGRFGDWFTPRPEFFFENPDETMSALGARAGDLVAVRASTSAQSGETVIARIGAKLAWRRLKETDDGSVELSAVPAEGEQGPAPTVMAKEALRIEGVVIGVLSARPLKS